MTCPACGANNQLAWGRCWVCERALPIPPGAPTEPTRTALERLAKIVSLTFAIVLAAGALFFVTCTGYFMFGWHCC